MLPILVFGKKRSGTKWLSNLISSHPRIAAVKSAKANGILETNLLDRYPNVFGSLKVDENKNAFIRCFSGSKYFENLSVSLKELEKIDFNSYPEFLKKIMNIHASKENSTYWLQKFSTDLIPTLKKNFPKAVFVFIERNCSENVVSSVGLKKHYGEFGSNRKAISLIKETALWSIASKRIQKYKEDVNSVCIEFSDLVNNTQKIVGKVYSVAKIKSSEARVKSKFSKNSSFRGSVSKKNMTSSLDRIIIIISKYITATIPIGIYEIIYSIRPKPGYMSFNARTFIRGSFDTNPLSTEGEEGFTG
jgi:hypothetical protein